MSTLAILGVMILFAYIATRGAAGWLAGFTGARYRAYRSLAERHRGRYEGRGVGEPPTVSFEHRDSSVRVGLAPRVAGREEPSRTRVVTRFARGLPFRLELAPVARPAPPQHPKGTRIVRSGDPGFDREFVVQANDPEMARAFLDLEGRRALAILARLGPAGGILVSVNPERLLIQVDRDLGTDLGPLDAMVEASLRLHDALQAGVRGRLAEGIAILEPGPEPEVDLAAPTCKVCGDPIDSPRHVLCETCRAPHHADCWEFIGGCSIYGCRGKRAVPA